MKRVVIAGDRIRDGKPDPDAETLHVVSSRALAKAIVARPGLACLASPDDLPVADAAIDEVLLDRSITGHDLAVRLREAARTIAPGGTLRLKVPLRSGFAGFRRRLAAALLPVGRPWDPDALAHELLLAGFDRITAEARGALGTFTARRLPGRSRNSP